MHLKLKGILQRGAFPLSAALTAILITAPQVAKAQVMLPGLNNPVTDPGADTRKAEDNRRIAEFLRIDSNNDAILDANEISQHRAALFQTMDSDANGQLARSEFTLRRLDQPLGGASAAFSKMDADRNNVLSLAEFTDAVQRAADINDDGELSMWEYRTQN